jgi:hypothetical protein
VNPDLDTDPDSDTGPDFDPIRIQGFDDKKLKKKIKLTFLKSKIAIYVSLDFHK